MRVCIVQRSFADVETFIRAHAERLPGVVGIVSRDLGVPALDGKPLCNERPRTALQRFTEILHGRGKLWDIDHAHEIAFRRTQADVILAEYGPHGVRVLKACQRAAVPLVVHFHGADASRHKVLRRYAADYRRMFAQAAAVIAVSRAMERQLTNIGCPPGKLVYLPYGVDCDTFAGARPLTAPPQFLAVGRMVEKKAPNLTLMAFARVLEQCPDARLENDRRRKALGHLPQSRRVTRARSRSGVSRVAVTRGCLPGNASRASVRAALGHRRRRRQ